MPSNELTASPIDEIEYFVVRIRHKAYHGLVKHSLVFIRMSLVMVVQESIVGVGVAVNVSAKGTCKIRES